MNPGIYVPEGKTLTIDGNGTLNAAPNKSNENTWAAGIGGGYGASNGNIVIKGGVINAIGGEYAPGIGNSYNTNGGYIRIEGGRVNATGGRMCPGIGNGYLSNCCPVIITQAAIVTAVAGEESPRSIGKGLYSRTEESVTIGCTLDSEGKPVGGHVGGISTSPFTYFHYTIAIDDGSGNMVTQEMDRGFDTELTLTNNFSRDGYTFMGWMAENAGTKKFYSDGTKYSDLDVVPNTTITLSAQWMKGEGTADNPYEIASEGEWLTAAHYINNGGGRYNDKHYKLMADISVAETVAKGATPISMIGIGDERSFKGTFDGNGTQASPYVIASAADWNGLSSNVSAGENYDGKYIQLGANITVSRTVGRSAANCFKGHFDGAGNKLTFNYTGVKDNIAPFGFVNGATIENLHVDGTISTSGSYVAGLIINAQGENYIRNCRSSITFNCTATKTYESLMWSGFIVKIEQGTTVFMGCVFDGSFLSAKGYKPYMSAGFVCHSLKDVEVAVNDCVFDPVAPGVNFESFQNFVSGSSATVGLNNSYYTVSLDTDNQGKDAIKIIADEGITMEGNGIVTEYNVSGITGYLTGLKYKGNLYAASAGMGWLLVVNQGTVSLNVAAATITVQTRSEEVYGYQGTAPTTVPQVAGYWTGTFDRIYDEDAEPLHAYGMRSDGLWQRCRVADNNPRQSWIETFRAYFQTADTYDVDTFTPMYTFTGAADEVETGAIEAFPTDHFVGDLPDGQATAVRPTIRTVEADGTSRYFDLNGRQIGTKPVRGVYILNGKKFVSNPSRDTEGSGTPVSCP